MDPILRKSLGAAKAGHEGVLAGFGLERYIVYGPPMGSSLRQWEERLTLRGNGEAAYENMRSITDGSGDEVGLYRGTVSRQALADVIELVDQVGLMDEAPYRIEPADMAIRITIIAGGIEAVKHIGVNEPERIQHLQPLFRRLQEIELRVRNHPARTMSIEMSTPESAEVGMQVLPVNLRFVNRGTESYWINHPRSLGKGAYYDRCSLNYGLRPSIEPGITPPPIEVMEAVLRPDREEGLQMIWLPAGAVQEARLLAEVNFHQPGEFLLRAVYSNYSGEDLVGGVPRMRGCVFSAENSMPVSG
ncbi:MAG: hypothetical protein HYX27_22815 [Acidobacteria bacterium]|nr:hypothetical protein [Acidobacteriota bacterium]